MSILKQVSGLARVSAAIIAALCAAPVSAQLTLGNGTNPTIAPAPICPAVPPALAQPVLLDSFTLRGSVADSVTVLQIRMAPAGAARAVAKVESPTTPGASSTASTSRSSTPSRCRSRRRSR